MGEAARPGPETVRVTPSVSAVPPVGVTVIVPVYEPAARPAGVVVTVRLALPVPDVGVTASHVPPPLVMALAVKLCDPLTCRVWAAGEAPPWTYANASELGVTRNPAPAIVIGTKAAIPKAYIHPDMNPAPLPRLRDAYV